MRMVVRTLALLTAAAIPGIAAAQSGTVTNLSSQVDVMKAGGNLSGSNGAVPTAILLDPGIGRILSVTGVTGSVGCAFGAGFNADGVNGSNAPCVNAANVNSAGSISGLVLGGQAGSTPSGRSIALIGVFLGPSLPGSTPSRLTYGDAGVAYDLPSYSGLALGQTFYVGDALTGVGSGTAQTFAVPDGATRLYFGFVDAGNYIGNPGAFNDNVGTLSFDYAVAAPGIAPEPATLSLVALGIVGVAAGARRRARG